MVRGFLPRGDDGDGRDGPRRDAERVRWPVVLLVVVLCLASGVVARVHSSSSVGLRIVERVVAPAALERSRGYRPVGEVAVPGKRRQDHVVRTVRSGGADRYVCWTSASTPLKTILTIPGAVVDGVRGPSVSVSITLRSRPAVIWGTPSVTAAGVVHALANGLVAGGVEDNTPRFNLILRLLPSSIPVTVSFPKGRFAFTGVIRMRSDTTVVGHRNETDVQLPAHRRGDLVVWYPTGGARGYGGMHDVTWRDVVFRGEYSSRLLPTQTIFESIIHASDITFDHCVFRMVQRPHGHLLDVDGSTDVTVRYSTVIGSPNRGQTFKEAFQMDVAALGAQGYRDRSTVFDDTPTSHMTIEHCRFLPLRDSHGRLLLPAAAPFGTHMAYARTTADSSYIHDGVFRDNYVEDPVYYEGAGSENSAVIHFDAADDITITGNTFVWTGETGQSSWAVAFYSRSHRMVKPRRWHGIIITDNVFRGFAPKLGVFDLYREPDSATRPGRSVSGVVVRGNRFEGTPLRLALVWLRRYPLTFIVTHDQTIRGSDDVADGTIHLDGVSAEVRRG